jgi:hypothetical protein
VYRSFVVRLRLLTLLAPLALAAPLLSACEDTGFLPDVFLSKDTVTLGLPGSELPSALDIARPSIVAALLVRPEALSSAGEWDLGLRRSGAVFSLRPNEATGAGVRGAGIAVSPTPFETAEEAPRATSAYSTVALPLTVGTTYFSRSRQFAVGVGACVRYAKIKVLALDQAAGTAQLALVINENCDDERLTDD